MSLLEHHHEILVEFLSDVREKTPKFSFIPSKSEEWEFLSEVIQLGVNRKKLVKVPGFLGRKAYELTRLVDKLNELLCSFSSNTCNIAPPIQLYYKSEGRGYPGGHFACCKPDSSSDKSCHFLELSNLEEEITAARQKLKIDIQQSETLVLNNKVYEINENNENQNLFRFEYCWPNFVGRDKEMQRLRKFVNYKNKNLLWWTITGNGGTGKSRLALELCQELKKEGWHTGFLGNTIGSDIWRKWKPQRSTLIVVDYNHEKAKELGEHIGNKYEESKKWNHPVRILFLERNEKSEALRQFCHPHSEILKNNIRYNELDGDKNNPSLQLRGLGDEFIDSIIAGIFERYPKKQPSADEIKTIKGFLKGKGHENRPLYAMFVADACARGEDVRGWDIEKLHESVLEHNKNIWKRAGIDETNELDKKHINLLILATMTNGVKIKDDNYAECLKVTLDGLNAVDILPAKHKFKNSKYQILCDDEVNEELGPMAPDILGEYFVLQRWKDDIAEICEVELLTKIAWQYRPERMIDFITRVAMDFPNPNDTVLDKIIEYAKIDENTILLVNLTRVYSNAREFNKAVEYYECLENLWNGSQKDKQIAFDLASAAVNLTSGYGKAKKLDKAVNYYNRVEDLWNSGYQKDKKISFTLAGAAMFLSCHYGQIGEPDKAVKYHKRIEDLWNSGYQKDREITLILAGATIYLSCYYGEAGELDKAVKYHDCLEDLWNSGYQKDREITLDLASTAFNLTHYYIEAGELDKAVKYHECLEDLWNSGYQRDGGISCKLARAAMLLSCYYGETGELDKAVKYHDSLEDLWNSGYQKDGGISVMLAQAAKSLSYYYGQARKFDKAVKYYKHVEDLWNSGYQRDREISLGLASAALSLSYCYGDARELDKVVEYHNHLEDLWNSGYQKDRGISVMLAQATGVCSIEFAKKGQASVSEHYKKKFIELYNSFPESKEIAAMYTKYFAEDKDK